MSEGSDQTALKKPGDGAPRSASARRPAARKNPRRSISTAQQLERRRALLALPATAAFVLGVALVAALLAAPKIFTTRQLQQRADRALARGDAPAAAINFRRLLQQSPNNAAYRESLAVAMHASEPK